MAARLPRWLLRLVIALGVIMVVYIVGANAFLNMPWGFGLINKKPEKLWIQWASGWTVIPGVVHVEGLQIRGQDRKFQWYATLDEITVWVAMTALVRKTFSTNAMRGRGLEFRMRERIQPGQEPPPYNKFRPDIPGLTNPPQPPPEALYPPTTPKRPWTIELSGGVISELRSLWIENFRWQGDGRVEGGMRHIVKGTVEVPSASLLLEGGDVRASNEPALKDVRIESEITLDRFHPKKEKGLKALGFISGAVRIAGELENLEFLKVYFRHAPWLQIDGHGQLDADMRLKNGVLQPETKLSVITKDMATNIFGYNLDTKGHGTIEGRVDVEGEKSVAKLALTLDEFAVAPPGTEQMLIRGRNLRFGGETADLDLRAPFKDLTYFSEVRGAEIGELTVLNRYIPKKVGFTIRSGSGLLGWHFRATVEQLQADGEIEVQAKGFAADYQDIGLAGDVTVAVGVGYAKSPDGKGLQLFPEPVEVNEVSLTLRSAEIKQGKQTAARDLDLELKTQFDEGRFELEKALGVLRFTSAALQFSGTVPDLRYLNTYLPKKSALHIGKGAAQVKGAFASASGEADVKGNFSLSGTRLKAKFEDLGLAGDLNLNGDLRYAVSGEKRLGLVVFAQELGQLEVLKGALDFKGATIRQKQQAIADELLVELRSTFNPGKLNTNNISALVRPVGASARILGNIPSLRYLNRHIPKDVGMRLRSGRGQLSARFETAAGQADVAGEVVLNSKTVRAEIKDTTISGDLGLTTDVHYGVAGRRGAKRGLVVLTEGPLAIDAVSLQLKSGEVLLREGQAIQNLTVEADSKFDHHVLKKNKGRDVLRAVTGTVNVAGQFPGLQFLKAYFRQAPWIDLNGSGDVDARLKVRQGVLSAGSRVVVDADVILANFLDYSVRGSGKVRGDVAPRGGKQTSTVTISLEDFEVSHAAFDQPYIFGSGFSITGTATTLDLRDPFTDLKVALDLPESELPNFAVYNKYVPPEACTFIHQGSGRISSRLDFDAKTQSAKGRIDLHANRLIAQFSNMTFAGDMKVAARLRGGNIEARRFDMSGTEVEFNNVYVGTAKVGTDNTWWMRLALPKGEGVFTAPAKLDAKFEMSMRDTRPVVVFLSEKKGIVRWFKNTLTVKDVKAQADFKMDGQAIEVEDLEMKGEKLEILGELDIFAQQFAGVFFARLRDLQVGVELGGGRKKFKLSKARPWFDKRRQVYRAHKWFAQQEGRQHVMLAEAPKKSKKSKKDERSVKAPTQCWQRKKR
ncbi:MAG: hypothetical protein ACE5K1_06070 [Acidiferrobacterales bacterium]